MASRVYSFVFYKDDYDCQQIKVIHLWLILLTLSDLYLVVELITWTATDVILSFFAWMPDILFVNEEEKKGTKERARDQVNQQCERYWLKHYHFLYESVVNQPWGDMWLCANVHLQLSHARSNDDLILTTDVNNFKYCSGQSIERNDLFSLLSHFSFDKIIWIMINLHWNQPNDDEHHIDNRNCLF